MDVNITINSLKELEKFLSIVKKDSSSNYENGCVYVEYEEFEDTFENFNKKLEEVKKGMLLLKHDFLAIVKHQNLIIEELKKQVVMPIICEANIHDQSV